MSAHSKLRPLWGSFLAVASAWLVAIVLFEVGQVVHFISSREELSLSWSVLWVAPLWFSMWNLGIRLADLAACARSSVAFRSRTSVLWRWPICTACGALAGALAVAVVFPFPRPGIASQIWVPYALGAVIGAITCCVGSVIRHRFERPQTL